MERLPEVDVLLATWQGERFLEAQLGSLLHQEAVAVRIFVHDDHSTDRTVDLLDEWSRRHPDRFVRVTSDSKQGVRRSFERVLRASRAPYVAFSDQDDVWHPTKLRKLVAAAVGAENRTGGSEPVLVHCDVAIVDEALRVVATSGHRHVGVSPDRCELHHVLAQNPVIGCAALLNRALVDRMLPIPDAAVMHDYWASLVASAAGRIVYVREPLVSYRQHLGNTVGAHAYSISRVARSMIGAIGSIEALRAHVNARRAYYRRLQCQAAALADHLTIGCSESDRMLLEDFAALDARSWLERRRFLLRNDVLMARALRNLELLLWC